MKQHAGVDYAAAIGTPVWAVGDGTVTRRPSPTRVPGLVDVAQISAGAFHACAAMRNGTARCWGNNDFGQLGTNNTTSRVEPTAVPEIKEALQRAAELEHRSIANMVEVLIREHCRVKGIATGGTSNNKRAAKGATS